MKFRVQDLGSRFWTPLLWNRSLKQEDFLSNLPVQIAYRLPFTTAPSLDLVRARGATLSGVCAYDHCILPAVFQPKAELGTAILNRKA